MNDFAAEPNIHQAIPHYFIASSPVENVKLVYLSTILGNQYLLHPYYRNQSFLVQTIQKMPSFVEIECSLTSCDIWFRTCNIDLEALIPPVQSKKRFSIQTYRFENKKRCIEKSLPWCHQECPADLVIITEDYKSDFQLNSFKGKNRFI